MIRSLVLATVAAAALAASACAPVTSYSGFQAREDKPADVKVGVDTKSTVMTRLGSPSTQSAFGGDSWFYISQITEKEAYHLPKVTARSVVEVNFDKDEKVASVRSLTMKDGYAIAFDRRQTPTRGRDLTLLEQVMGTIGRSGLLPQEDDPGNRPGNRR